MKYLKEYKEDEFTCPECGEEHALESTVATPTIDGKNATLKLVCLFCGIKFKETYKIEKIERLS